MQTTTCNWINSNPIRSLPSTPRLTTGPHALPLLSFFLCIYVLSLSLSLSPCLKGHRAQGACASCAPGLWCFYVFLLLQGLSARVPPWCFFSIPLSPSLPPSLFSLPSSAGLRGQGLPFPCTQRSGPGECWCWGIPLPFTRSQVPPALNLIAFFPLSASSSSSSSLGMKEPWRTPSCAGSLSLSLCRALSLSLSFFFFFFYYFRDAPPPLSLSLLLSFSPHGS